MWMLICIHFSIKNPSKIYQKSINKTTSTTQAAQDAPRRSQDAPKTRQDAPKTPQDGPRRPQDTPKTRQDASQTAQTRPGGATKGAKLDFLLDFVLDPLWNMILV